MSKFIIILSILTLSSSLLAQEEVFPGIINQSGPREEVVVENVVPQVEVSTQCRDVIVEAHKLVGMTLDPQSFSTTTFEQLNISVEEFNALSHTEQRVIYDQIMPMELKVEQTLKMIESVSEEAIFALMFGQITKEEFAEIVSMKTRLSTCVI